MWSKLSENKIIKCDDKPGMVVTPLTQHPGAAGTLKFCEFKTNLFFMENYRLPRTT